MNEHHLSQRLEAAAQFIPEAARLADIGSDHAYLPVFLMLQHRISWAIAGEVVAGPYESAKRQVELTNLSEKISVRLGDGLSVIHSDDQIDTITICGMGGQLICSILANGLKQKKLTGKERLILQPNVQAERVRHWLAAHDYCFLGEAIIEEEGKIYEIMAAEKIDNPTTSNYSDEELLFGPFLLKNSSLPFQKKWQLEQKQLQNILDQLKEASEPPVSKLAEVTWRMQKIEEMLQKCK